MKGMHNDFYEHPFDSPHVRGSWCDRIVVRPAPVRAGVILRGPCWIWLGWNNGKRINKEGQGPYPKVWIDGRAEYLHRYMWEQHNGVSLQGGEFIDHLCRVRLCFSPHHTDCCDLEENNRRRDEYAARFSETHFSPELEAEIREGFGL